MKGILQRIGTVLNSLFSIVLWLVKGLIFVLDLFGNIFGFISSSFSHKLRFSLTFRITTAYAFIFLIIFLLMSLGIMVSFSYYIQTYPPEDYLYLLGGILAVFNLIGFLAIIFMGSRASRRLLAPIKTMTQAVRDISYHQLDKRLDVSGSKNELKDLAQTFNDMLDRIQASVQQQNRFVSDASHELRTPISVIQGYTNLLARWGKDDRKILEESLTALQSEAENMNHLIEELLFVAREDSGRLNVSKEPFMLSEVIREILYETSLIDTDHQIISQQQEDFEIKADRKLIKEAIRILIDNSLKYTPDGGIIKLDCYLKNQKAVISIEDNGIGISKDDLPHIFNRFYRADESRTKGKGGTGLGLTIAKLIIDNHNGNIKVWSQINEGTIFRIELPLE
jgi:two-component system sensor histidine kinase ArlS